MKPWQPARLPVWLAVVVVLASASWASVFARNHLRGERSLVDRIEAPLADMRILLAGQRDAPSDIVIVAIDDATVSAEGRYPLDRSRLAELVRAIEAGRPTALAIDILLIDRSAPDADQALADALRRVPHVLAVAGLFDRDDRDTPEIPATYGELRPNDAFERPDAVGLVNVATDASGTPRHLPLLFRTSRGLEPSFALRAASLLAGGDATFTPDGLRLGDRLIPLDFGRHLPLRLLGPRGTIPTLSAEDFLAGRVPADRIRNSLVVLGVTATAVGDTFGTPFDPVTPGAEVLATGIANLTGETRLRRDATVRRVDVAATVTGATGGAILLAAAPMLPAVALAAGSILIWTTAALVLFSQGVWLSLALPLFGVVPPLLLVCALRQLVERSNVRMLARSEAALRSFQSPALLDRIQGDPTFLSEPVERTAAIVFIDLAGFTRLAEKLGSSETHAFLARYHSIVETESAARGGIVMNFMGDGAMILFGILEPSPDEASRAVETVFALAKSVRDLIAETDGGAGFLDVRLGAHRGLVMLSRLGHASHQQITVSGDNVNIAARLMEVGKLRAARTVISQDLLDAAGLDAGRPPPAETTVTAIRGLERNLKVGLWT